MRLFKYEGYEVNIEPEALLLQPFKAIWDRDKTKSKDRAKNELAYCYFIADPRSDYQYLIDIEERHKEIIKGLGFEKTWKPDKLLKDAIKFYDNFKTTGALLLEDTKGAIDQVRKILRTFDLSQSDDVIRDSKDLVAMVKMVPSLVKDLEEAERTINQEMAISGKARGSIPTSILDRDLEA